jgi:hypothetical protein
MTRLERSALRLTLSFIATVLLTTAAQALPQTFVSAAGNNANSCERADPCRTFAGALVKTDADGEIIVLDAGEYGPVNITKAAGNQFGFRNDPSSPGTLKSFGNNRVNGNTTNTAGTITPISQM